MTIIRRVLDHLLWEKITTPRWRMRVMHGCMFSLGILFGLFFLTKEFVLPQIFAATSWTQTNWSGGVGPSTSNQYVTSTNIDTTTTAGEFSLEQTPEWSVDYTNWLYRKKIYFDNTDSNLGTPSETLTNFPVLVKLDGGTDIDYAKTQDLGQDIRFTDSDGTVLNYEIEKWDEAGSSYVWVNIPQIDVNSNTDSIYMYYGNLDASDAQNSNEVWDSNFLGVWHSNDSSSTIIRDSTINSKNATKQSSNQPNYTSNGALAGAQVYSQSSSRAGTTINSSLGDFTVEVWFKDDGIRTAYERLADKSYTGCFWLGRNSSNPNSWGGGVLETSDPYGVFITLADGSWHQIASIRSGSTHYVYGNGGSVQNSNIVSTTACNSSNFAIGGWGDGSSPAQWFGGTIDEVRLSNNARSKAWIAASYKSGTDSFTTYDSEVPQYASSGVLVSNIFDVNTGHDWGVVSFASTTPANTNISVKVRSGNVSNMSDATDWESCTGVPSGALASTGGCVQNNQRYLQYHISLSGNGSSTPTLSEITMYMNPSDIIPPSTNASDIHMYASATKTHEIPLSTPTPSWNNGTNPHFEWVEGADNTGGTGLKGYCAYLGTDIDAEPGSSQLQTGTAGLLQNSPVALSDSFCGFIIEPTDNFTITDTYLSSALVDNTTYYFKLRAIDHAHLTYEGESSIFSFKHDSTPPTNVSYISTPGSAFSNVIDMIFSWPTDNNGGASDETSGLLGYQYQINGTALDGWKGVEINDYCGVSHIPAASASYALSTSQDGGSIVIGNNVVYFRSIDSACNTSTSSTYRTGNLAYAGQAPTFTTSCAATSGIAVTPQTSSINSYALSWEVANPASGRSVTNYYYMINRTPPSALSTITSNTSVYLDNLNNTSVSAGTLVGAMKGVNTIYIVAVDDADNYSPSNCLKGTFVLDSSFPDPPTSVGVSDASVKSASLWRASLAWAPPTYQGTGSLTYTIDRSTDNTSWTNVAVSTGTAYVDTVASSTKYFWRVGVYDTSAQSVASPSYATAVALIPKGTYAEAASLSAGPTVSSITTRKATIGWSTNRTSDSKVTYGVKTGTYYSEQPSTPAQVTNHSITLANLSPGTTYFYRARWTDEDGNTGESEENSFTTGAAPTITDPKIKTVGLSTAIIQYTVKNADKIKIYYGKSTAFGAAIETSTAQTETTLLSTLENLDDGTKYFYRINTFDTEGAEYEGNTLTFETLPRPKVSNVRFQEVEGSAQPAMVVSWDSNTAISSVVTYYPQGSPANARDEVSITLVKGSHQLLLKNLFAQTVYAAIVKGTDSAGNEAVSDVYTFTTSTDTRPPQIFNLKVEGTNIPQIPGAGQELQAQLVVAWDTDEPATSQVEFGEGSSTSYPQKTQEDANLTTNHVVIISGITPSKVYHLERFP